MLQACLLYKASRTLKETLSEKTASVTDVFAKDLLCLAYLRRAVKIVTSEKTASFGKTASRFSFAGKTIRQMYDMLAKRRQFGMPAREIVQDSALKNPIATKNTLVELARGGVPDYDAAVAAARARWVNQTVPRLSPAGKPVSPFSLPDNAETNLWHGVVPREHLGELFDSAGRFAWRDPDGIPYQKKIWWAAAPEIAAGFGVPARRVANKLPGYVMQQRTDALKSVRLPDGRMSEAITAHQPGATYRLQGPSLTPRETQFEAVADNTPLVPQKIYQVLPDARQGAEVPLHPQSRQRRVNPEAFLSEVSPEKGSVYQLHSQHMLQPMTFSEPSEAVLRRMEAYLKMLGDLNW